MDRKGEARSAAIAKYDAHPRIVVSRDVKQSHVQLHESGGAWVRVWVYLSSEDLAPPQRSRGCA